MAEKRATWDPAKAARNVAKHKVTFEEAETVFSDPLAMWLADLEHGEARLNVIGISERGRHLFVVTIELEEDEFRIISARKAERHERNRYEEGE
jgi:uncharacterized DUF497 family protein